MSETMFFYGLLILLPLLNGDVNLELIRRPRLDTKHVFEIPADTRYKQQHKQFDNCNKTNALIYLNSLDFEPSPIHLGKDLFILGSLSILEDIRDVPTVEGDLSLLVKAGDRYEELCNFIGMKYCHRNNLCQDLKNLSGSKICRQLEKYGMFNCSCPIKAHDINFPLFLPILLPSLPFDVNGQFVAILHIRISGMEISCIEIDFSIGSRSNTDFSLSHFKDFLKFFKLT